MTRRLPRPTPLGFALLLTILLLALGLALAVGRAGAQEADPLEAAALAVWATATPEPTPTEAPRYSPAARGHRPAVARWADAVAAYDDWDAPTALRVIECESKGDPDAVNPSSGAAGLFQLLGWSGLARRLFGTGDVLVPWVNVAVAHVLWLDSGGTFRFHWAASWGCWS